MNHPLVSIIVSTKNNERTISACIESCVNQTYPNVEVIVIDNYSDDKTPTLAEKAGARVVTFGPERNLQRPKGAEEAKGDWLVFIDSDMTLSSGMVQDCINQFQENSRKKAFVLLELSVGNGFWTKCKVLERSFYIDYEPMLICRMYKTDVYNACGGWNPELISGEDFDLQNRLKKVPDVEVGICNEFLEHHEGEIKLWPFLKKKFYYGKFLKQFLNQKEAKQNHEGVTNFYLFRTCFYTNPGRALQYFPYYVGMFILLGFTTIAYVLGMMLSEKTEKVHK